ncbi:MAG: InlB B-repeat-containing protein [Collinsella sp.]|nr:InlB B-repeat-containing protein [Collinsella sp.]MDY5438481.1 InlB B-repeat-containing protein [Collinsella sp.]
MNRKLNAAITAGLSLSMVLGSTPVTAIAAQVQQPAAKSATEANDWCVLNVYDEADGQQLLGIWGQKGQKVTEALEGNVPAKSGYKIDYLYTTVGQRFNYDEATKTWYGSEATLDDNMDLYAHFVEKQETPAAKQFTVTYYDGDTVLDKKTFDEDSFEYVNYTPQKDGYTFEGWAMNGSDEKIVATKNPLKGNWDLTALWKKNDSKPSTEKRTVLVQYFDEGYDPIIRVVDFEGSTTWMNQKPMDKPGKVFVGWKYTGADDSEIIKPGQPLNYTDESVNLQAVWADAPVEYATVTFYDEGDQPIGNATYQVGSFNWDAITPAPKDGKVFVGWKYTGASDDQIIDFATTPILADVSLQAVWKDAAKETHTVNFYDEGYDPIIQLVDFAGSTTWMNQTPAAKDGKVFVGWKLVGADDSEIIPAGTELKGDWNVQAVWKDAEAAVHTVTYYDEGYEPIGYGEIRAGQFNWDQVKPAAKDGYTFVGYKFTGDTDDHIIDFSKTAMPDADVCLQAVWQKNAEPTPEPTENEHTVTIYENGKVSTVKVKDGEKLSKPADPEAVAGYEFVGWSTSKSEMAQYDFDQPVTGDLTIYAMFNAKKETVENGKAEDSKKQVAADKKDEAKAEKKDAAALPTTGDPIFVVTSAASLAGAVAAAVGMYMTKRREH